MRKELGILVMENEKGEVAVQLFAEVASVERAFVDLKGSPADPPSRATLISMRYGEDGEANIASMSRMLPVIEPVEDRPDGYRLGEGPVKFPKEEGGEKND